MFYHGEMQMGIAIGPGLLNANATENWEKYITDKIQRMLSKQSANVLVYRTNSLIDAFCVLDVANDGDADFGIICDMLVKKEIRGNGMGKEMVNMSKIWFEKKKISDIYLESGLDNHTAHKFFQKNGFKPISQIFKLSK